MKRPPKVVKVEMKGHPHNGDGRPDLQFPDPVSGEKIGGQIALIRMAMRYKHVVAPWARRQGKTRARQFLFVNEAALTPGPYWAGICFPDHTTAAKIADVFRQSWGDMVHSSKINDKDQDRWIQLHGITPPDWDPPAWLTPRLRDRWIRAQKGDRNEFCKVYFWGAAHPHYQKIQGFPHPFMRVDWDECQEIHPRAYGIVRPMLRDVRGAEMWTGTPWREGIGNVKFEKFWVLAGDPKMRGWFRMRIPDGTNPFVPPTDIEEARRSMTDDEIEQTMNAAFLSGEGALFSNLGRVIVLDPIRHDDPSISWVKRIRSLYSLPTMQSWVHEAEARKGHTYCASVDWARSPRGDWTAVTVFDLTNGHQVALFRWRGEDFTAQMLAVLAIQTHYKAEQLHSDANGMGETMSDFLRRRHALGFIGHKFGRNKGDYVRRGQILVRDCDVKLIRCPEQYQEFKNFSAFESEGLGSEKLIKYCAPEGEHDDIVAAFLQLAPTLTISGRASLVQPEADPEPMFMEDHATTTLEKFVEGMPLPPSHREPTDEITWRDVVLTK